MFNVDRFLVLIACFSLYRPDMVRTAQEMQQNNPEMFENLRQQAAQFAPPQQGEASQDTPKDSSEQKEQ